MKLLLLLSSFVLGSVCYTPSMSHGTFNEALTEMPDWPKMVLFLPKGTQETDEAFEWHKNIQEEMGSRILLLTIINDTAKDKQIFEIFKLTNEDQLPCAKVVKPGSVDLESGKLEAYQPQERGWSYSFLTQLADQTALPALRTYEKEANDLDKIQVQGQSDMRRLCMNAGQGRCAIWLVDMTKKDKHLELLRDALTGFNSVFYNFHVMWADMNYVVTYFNFPDTAVDPRIKPQMVILDQYENVFAPQKTDTVDKIRRWLRIFDQKGAMAKIKEASKKRKSAGDSRLLPTDVAAAGSHPWAKAKHTEL